VGAALSRIWEWDVTVLCLEHDGFLTPGRERAALMEEKEGRLLRRSGLGFPAYNRLPRKWSGLGTVSLSSRDSRGGRRLSFGGSHQNHSAEFTLNWRGDWDSIYSHFHQDAWSLVGGLVSHFPRKERGLPIPCPELQHPRHAFKTW